VAAPAGGQLYTVQSGDTLYSIARKFGVSWETIYDANRDILSSPDELKAGQQLRIPAS
jgi:nucleoid-associated protein YgaU